MGLRGQVLGPGQACRLLNYLNDLRHLEAGSQRSNRQKADQVVAEWLPVESARCRYLTYWVPIKLSWGLAVDTAKLDALNALAEACPDSDITPVPGRSPPARPGRAVEP
ncbi:hypothetical protein GCM10010377_71160 [Streptomyces viridiviolaceus]|nr:hypothetical protein GCM10010377_71160 [Streptomyces viridiviolaceus]